MKETYEDMVGRRWIVMYFIIGVSLGLTGRLFASFVRVHAEVFLALLFFGPPVLPYLFIPPRRFWRASW